LVIRRITDALKRDSVEDWLPPIESAFVSLLNNWRVWCGSDELRAFHIAFSVVNTELSVNFLTDREPYLIEDDVEPLGESWPTANWRLTDVADQHVGFSSFVAWLKKKATSQSASSKIDKDIHDFLFRIATSRSILEQISRFKSVQFPFPIKVESLDTRQVFDYSLPKRMERLQASSEERAELTKHLVESLRLEKAGKCGEAISLLKSYLEQSPHDELAHITQNQINKMLATNEPKS
jgi:hypothetical protein